MKDRHFRRIIRLFVRYSRSPEGHEVHYPMVWHDAEDAGARLICDVLHVVGFNGDYADPEQAYKKAWVLFEADLEAGRALEFQSTRDRLYDRFHRRS